ncbi:DUF4238 domain-containing protein [Comamonas sp.]|uniref:DUF4238 domain-containing protein n=1 Tax=Comamonas sp. TaxID=34028 RepID=UPI00264877FC|nr:DUF4238 domain-containing protein [Comamonas sp.]MDN5536596.1 DUF4238 domain-containing protein [Comamonas sp.]
MTARQHHYLSQCYLKGFTKGQSKKSKLTVIDMKERKSFESSPRNVGGVRDFNRIDLEGVDPDQLELELSRFESDAATALKQLKETHDFSGERREKIIYLMALIAVRSPERRESMRQFQAQIAEVFMSMLHGSKELWDGQMAQMKRYNPEFVSKVTYEDSKRFFEGKKYTLDVRREFHIKTEMALLGTVVPYLANRKWMLVTSSDEEGNFITTDWPVSLSWTKPEEVPEPYRRSPGFGMLSTEVYFPVSQDLALIGEFEGEEGVVCANKGLVAALNTKMLYNFYKQIYSPNLDFKFLGRNGEFLGGKKLLDWL